MLLVVIMVNHYHIINLLILFTIKIKNRPKNNKNPIKDFLLNDFLLKDLLLKDLLL
jgi:hypothetical protein